MQDKDKTKEQLIAELEEQRQRADELEVERSLLRILIDSLPDYVFIKDTKGRFTLSNTSHNHKVGVKTLDEIIGKTDFDFNSQELATRYHADDQLVLQSGQIVINRLEPGIQPDGDSRWVLTTKLPLKDHSGKIIGLLGIARDITKRKQMEEELKQHRHELEELVKERTAELQLENFNFKQAGERIAYQAELLQNVTDSIFSTDLAFNITSWNQAAETMYGWKVDEVIGKSAGDIVMAEYFDQTRIEVQRQLKEKGKWKGEAIHKRKDGTSLYVLTSAILMRDNGGNSVGVVAICQDITERKQAERLREQLIAELKTNNTQLERFTYTVSHDLKSPLITIRGFLGMLEQDIADGNIDRIAQDQAFILNASNKMLQLLDELLELSRIGKVIKAHEQIPLNVIVNEAIDTILSGHIWDNLSLELMPNMPFVYIDRIRIREVFENLISNAVKYIGDQSAPRIEIGVREDNGEMVIFVRDNGIGIDSKYHETIFGLFNQLDQSIEGTGLGLAIVRRIIEAHNGRIWVESDGKNQGSTFCFTIPKSDTDLVQS